MKFSSVLFGLCSIDVMSVTSITFGKGRKLIMRLYFLLIKDGCISFSDLHVVDISIAGPSSRRVISSICLFCSPSFVLAFCMYIDLLIKASVLQSSVLIASLVWKGSSVANASMLFSFNVAPDSICLFKESFVCSAQEVDSLLTSST